MIESLADALRPTREPQVSYFVGLVDSLFGDPDEQGRVRGEVQLLIFNQEERIKARVNLDPDDYHTAWKAHGVGGYVSLNGKLVRGDRLNLITKYRTSGFSVNESAHASEQSPNGPTSNSLDSPR